METNLASKDSHWVFVNEVRAPERWRVWLTLSSRHSGKYRVTGQAPLWLGVLEWSPGLHWARQQVRELDGACQAARLEQAGARKTVQIWVQEEVASGTGCVGWGEATCQGSETGEMEAGQKRGCRGDVQRNAERARGRTSCRSLKVYVCYVTVCM